MKASLHYFYLSLAALMLAGIQSSTAQDESFPGDALLDDPLLAEAQQLPGRVEDIGTSFAITDSDYLNITLQSTEPVQVRLESAAEMVVLRIEATPDTLSMTATLAFTGFASNTTYYKYEDDFHNLEVVTTDEAGCFSLAQDLSEPHTVFVQTRPSTIFIPSDTTVGTWNAVTRTYKLTMDIDQTIQIDEDNLTLDGRGYAVTGSGSGIGVRLFLRTGVTVKDLVVSNFFSGISLDGADGNSLLGNTLSGCHYGIQLDSSSDNVLADNVVDLPDIYNVYECIRLNDSDGNTLHRNSVSSAYDPASGGSIISVRAALGITVELGDNNILTENTASHCKRGIGVSGSNNILTDNTVSYSFQGIKAGAISADSSIVGNNQALGNQQGIRTYNILPTGNTMTGNLRGMNVSSVPLGGGPAIDTSNVVDGKPVYIVMNVVGQVFDSSIAPLACIYAGGCADITIRDLTLSNNSYGICLMNTTGSTIENVVAVNNYNGIQLISSDGNNLIGNRASDNDGTGIPLYQSNGNTLTGNSTDNTRYHGIVLNQSDSNTLTGNTAVNNSSAGFLLDSWCENNTLSENTASHAASGYGFELRGINTVEENTSTYNRVGITMQGGAQTLRGNVMEGNTYGFVFSGPQFEHIIENNSVDGKPVVYKRDEAGLVYDSSNDPACIIAINCPSITVSDLTLSGNGYGVYLYNTPDATINRVVASSNYKDGIALRESPNCMMDGIVAVGNGADGIYLSSSDGAVVTGSALSDNRSDGIVISDCHGITLTGNTVSTSINGLSMGRSSGAVVDNTFSLNRTGLSVWDVADTTFYNNNFINNTIQSLLGSGQNAVYNLSRLEGGGNFWSDWTSPDVDGDWFVDYPYEIESCFLGLPLADELPWTIVDGWKATPEELPVGTTVTSSPVDPNSGTAITLTFDNVTAAGETIVTTTELDGVMDPPEGYKIGDSDTLFFIATTATYDGFIEIALPYTTEVDPALFHYLDGAWVDVTTSIDTVNKIIYGEVASLSPFAVFEPVNTTPPTLTVVASPHMLWPANHQFVPVSCSLTVTDDTDPDPMVELVSLACNEYDNAIGAGDGNTHGDMEAADGDLTWDDTEFLLRAERAGSGDGRIYTITYRATDDAGNSTEAEATVYVPKNQGSHDCGSPDCDLNGD